MQINLTTKPSVCSCTYVNACNRLTPNPTNVASRMDGNDSASTMVMALDESSTITDESTAFIITEGKRRRKRLREEVAVVRESEQRLREN